MNALDADCQRVLHLLVPPEANLALLVQLVVPLDAVAGLADLDDGQAGAEGLAGRLRGAGGARGQGHGLICRLTCEVGVEGKGERASLTTSLLSQRPAQMTEMNV